MNALTISVLSRQGATRLTKLAALVTATVFSASLAHAMPVDLGQASNFAALALNGGIDSSGPLGPQAPNFGGNVGVASAGQKFQASGSVTVGNGGQLFLHTGDTVNSSAPGVPPPQPQNAANDAFLTQARTDALNASQTATALGQNPATLTGTFATISSPMTITENAPGRYVFNIGSINLNGGDKLTLNGPAGATFVLNVTGSITLNGGGPPQGIFVSGGVTAADVLINYTGNQTIQFTGGGNASQVFGTILAPNVEVGLHPGFVAGSVIANNITMSSGADIGGMVVPEVTPGSVLLGFAFLVVAVGSRKTLMARWAARKSAQVPAPVLVS
ncbi:MAG: choice-of-anchor A family protein, partial [Verrucomicrobia bacterium]|nr:choice-of-anchor A family protein [Verrucomicrobiota bacterium]